MTQWPRVRAKAAVNAPHSRRFARFGGRAPTCQCMVGGDFGTAFTQLFSLSAGGLKEVTSAQSETQ